MCTLIFWYRAFEGSPLIVAANRDERLDRPSAPPSMRQLPRRRVLCPTDLQAGGTWLGINDRRFFAAITNRFGRKKHDGRRSRGELVLEALDHDSAESAALAVAGLDPHCENAFNLAIADEYSAHLISCDGDAITHRRLSPGLHVITERSFETGPTAREFMIRSRLDALTEPDAEVLTTLLSSHSEDGFEGVCVHVPRLNYGTRSSTILRVSNDVSFLFADGPPHQTPYLQVDTTPIA
jgi:uncharacterized protein with NRDE domain